jgi:riboflavin synthase
VFTGLIQDLGELKGMGVVGGGAHISIATSLAPEIAEGDSVAVDGVCLTATRVGPYWFDVDAMNQTLAVTGLKGIRVGKPINLELAMKVGDRFGGHILQGHVDGMGDVISVTDDGIARRIRFELPPTLLRYVVNKGSIALKGVSLTVADLGDSWAEVSLIPETLERTNLADLVPGDRLNVECDVIAKYVERLMSPFAGKEQS